MSTKFESFEEWTNHQKDPVIIVDGNAALFPMSWSKEECEEWMKSGQEAE